MLRSIPFPGARRLLTLGLTALALSQSAEARDLTLGEAFAIVQEQNLTLLVTREDVTGALQEYYRQRAGILPAVDLVGNQVRARSLNRSALGGGAGPRGVTDNSFEAKLSAAVPLVDARALTDWRLAKFNHEIAQLSYDALLQDYLSLTAQAYFGHLRNHARLRVIEANLERDRVLLDLATNQFEAGVATPIDVTRAEVRLAVDEKQLLQQQTSLLQTSLALKQLLDLPLDEDVQIPALEESQANLEALAGLPLESILAARPEYVQAKKELDRNRFARRAANWERFPTLDLIGEYGYAGREAFDGDSEREWLVGLTFRLPVFDGFRIRSNKLQADSLIRRQEHVVDQVVQQVESDFQFALQDCRSRQQQIAVTRKQVGLSERELDLARTRFQEGVADNRDVTEAQANLAEANDQLVDAILQYNLSRVALARVRGDVRLVLGP